MVLEVVELPVGVIERNPGLVDRIVKLEPIEDFFSRFLYGG